MCLAAAKRARAGLDDGLGLAKPRAWRSGWVDGGLVDGGTAHTAGQLGD